VQPDLPQLTEFLRARHRCLLITRRADGSPQSSPVSCGIDGAGRLLISTYPARAKVKNARRDSRVSACILSDDWNGPYVQVDGTADVLDLPAALDDFVTYFRSISGEHPDWDEYREAMGRQGKCLIRITITSWGPIATGGFPSASNGTAELRPDTARSREAAAFPPDSVPPGWTRRVEPATKWSHERTYIMNESLGEHGMIAYDEGYFLPGGSPGWAGRGPHETLDTAVKAAETGIHLEPQPQQEPTKGR